MEETMQQADSHFEVVVTRLRHMLPTNTATAQAIDQKEPWDQIAMKAIDDGYIESADEFIQFVEAFLRSNT
jgi:hypothetical protein